MGKIRVHFELNGLDAERWSRQVDRFPGRPLWYVVEMILDAAEGGARWIRHALRQHLNTGRSAEVDLTELAEDLAAAAERHHRTGAVAVAAELKGFAGRAGESRATVARMTAAIEECIAERPKAAGG